MLLDFAVEDPMDLILIEFIDLQRQRGVLEPIWDRADAGQLRERAMKH